jgi:hypothetical protein
MVNIILLTVCLYIFLYEGFRTPFGFLTIVLGIHCLPIVIYILENQVLLGWPTLLLYNIKNLCIIGRLFSFYCEVRHLLHVEKTVYTVSFLRTF